MPVSHIAARVRMREIVTRSSRVGVPHRIGALLDSKSFLESVQPAEHLEDRVRADRNPVLRFRDRVLRGAPELREWIYFHGSRASFHTVP